MIGLGMRISDPRNSLRQQAKIIQQFTQQMLPTVCAILTLHFRV